MSVLFNLPLIGVGSPDVESLSSYVYRLAHVHSTSVLKLLEHVFKIYSDKYPDRRIELGQFRSTLDLSILVRPNETTRKIVEILSYATGNTNLQCGTFLALSKVLHRSTRTFSNRMRWCRGCALNHFDRDNPFHFKLAWSLLDVTHCPLHHLRLTDTCAACGSYQSKLGFRRSLEFCCSCDQQLYRGSYSTERIDSWKHEAGDLLELVDLIATDRNLEFPADAISRVLSDILDKAWANEEENRLWKIMPRDDFLSAATGMSLISLASARRIAFQLGIRLPDLLEGRLRSTTTVLDKSWTNDLPAQMRPRKRPKTRERETILRQLSTEYFFRSKIYPPSLKEIAKRLNVSVGYLHYHFPIQAKEFIRLHRVYLEDKKTKERHDARVAVLKFYTDDITYYGIEKSRKNALRVLRYRTYLPKNLLRKEIDFVLRSLQEDSSFGKIRIASSEEAHIGDAKPTLNDTK